jgi:hypothetical protein
MKQTEELVKQKQANQSIVFTVGTTEFTVVTGDTQRIFAKGSVTHVIEEPRLVQQILKKAGINAN